MWSSQVSETDTRGQPIEAKLRDIRTIIVNDQACSIYFISVSKLYRYCGVMYTWLRPRSWSRHSQTRLLFQDQDKTKSFIQDSRGKTETFAFKTRVKSKTFIKRTRVKSKTFVKQTRVDSRPETLVSRSQVWFLPTSLRTRRG